MTHDSTRMEMQVSDLYVSRLERLMRPQIMDAVRSQCKYYLESGLEQVKPIGSQS